MAWSARKSATIIPIGIPHPGVTSLCSLMSPKCDATEPSELKRMWPEASTIARSRKMSRPRAIVRSRSTTTRMPAEETMGIPGQKEAKSIESWHRTSKAI